LKAGDVANAIVSFTVKVTKPKTVLDELTLAARKAASAFRARDPLCSVGTDDGWVRESVALIVPPPPVVAAGTRIEPLTLVPESVTLSGLVLETTIDPVALDPADGLGVGVGVDVDGGVVPPPPPPPPPHATSSEHASENAASLRIIGLSPWVEQMVSPSGDIVVRGVGGPA